MELANLVVAAAMGGVIWMVQLVHYPLFALVGEAGWRAYEVAHQRRITWLVGPLMLSAAALSLALLAERGGALAAANAALACGLLLATVLVYAPLHGRLAHGFDAALLARLVRLNWLRTAAWTAQVAVAAAMV